VGQFSAMATTYAQGTLIWLKDEEEVWIPASIVSSNEKEIIVKKDFDEGGEPQIRLPPNEPLFIREQLIYTSEGLSVIDDLCQLTHLHEPAVLSSLNHRFDIDKIYTFTGPILIAMNPFKRIGGLYGTDIMYTFIRARQKSTKPHVYNTAMDCFRAICDRQKCQTVLISGESGAGKTETTKHVMAFLAAAGAEEGEQTDVERQVLESNPLLEAFGNARTLRNDNSSRFGKFINLQFQAHPDAKIVASSGTGNGKALRLCGARIQTYLLEKVRVFDHQEGERNYHIFYEGCAAFKKIGGGNIYKFPQVIAPEKCVGLEGDFDLDGFAPLEDFALLTRSTCKVLAGQDDLTEFENRLKAMQTIGVSKDQVQSILYIMAAVLHLGNTKFDAPPSNSEASQVMSESKAAFDKMVSLCKVDAKALENALTNQTRVVMKEKVKSPVNIRQAADSRDALGKALYEMVFNFAVKIANASIGYKPDVPLFVGVLDIFGFECFKMNSFEQLCINFTNERLQQFFNQFVFKLEEQLYEREGIAWDPLDFPDNQDSVEILQKRGDGVFAMLDEECVVPGGSDSGFCNKLIKKYKGHRRFDEIRTKPTWFVIKHFAGPVQYATEGFLDKNKDQLNTDIIDVMASSSEPLLAKLFVEDAKYAKKPVEEAPSGGGKKKKIYTVSAEFKDQLTSLMDIVDATEPHFIRCIKPNPRNKPDEYDRKGVTEQLRYGGVLQVVQVSRAGYPVRITHQEAWDDYKICANADTVSGLRHVDDIKIRVEKLLDHLNVELNIPKPPHGGTVSWAVGKTMVFFKQVASERLEFSRRELLVKSTTMIQAHWRRKVRQDQYRALRVFTKHLQALLRGKESRAELMQLRRERAIVKMQALSRKHKDQKGYKIMLKYIIRVQAWRRGAVGRVRAKEYKKFTSATKIQAWFRKIRDRRVYIALHKVILVAQQRMRMHAAKSQMKKLKAEAKEVGALMAKSAKAAEQAAELRKKAEEMEAQLLQADSEKANLKNKTKTLEDQVADLTAANEELKKQNDDSAQKLNDPSMALVNSEEMDALKAQLSQKDVEMTAIKEEMAALKDAYAKSQESLSGAESRYQQLLKSTAMQSMSNLGGPGAGPIQSRPSLTGGAKPMNTASRSNRNVDIQIVGFQGTGKTPLMEELIKEYDPAQLQRFNEQKPNLMSHHQIQVGDRTLKLLDCSGNVRAQHLVKEWFGRSQWVFVVYDLCNAKSNETALELVRECVGAGARVMLLGNKHNNESQGQPIQVDVMQVKDAAARMEAWAMETANLHDAVKFAMNITDKEGPTGDLPGQGGPEGNDRRRSITAAIDSMKNWFGSSAPGGGGGPSSLATAGILRPSLKGTKAMKQARREGDSNADLRPVQELQDSESAVTCICFGQERLHKAYVLLATASKDGTVVIYRCYRTEMEVAMLQDTDFPQDDAVFSAPPADHSNIAVHSRLVGHSRAITSIFFNLLEDQLVTTSIDKSVRFWGVDSGEMLKVFTDSSAVPVAAFLPFNPQVFVAANSNAVLRLVNVQNGMVLQKLKVETEVRALKFDDTGLFLLAGTKNGGIHVLEASDSSTLKFKFKVQLARGGVTCITFVQASYGQPPCLLVNTSDSSATIIDCTYGPPAGVLTNLTVRHRVRVAHSLLPLKCCYSPSGQGYLISGSEDKEVYIYSLAKASNYKMQYLKHHQVPVVAVAVNLQDTLLASADSLGKIVLWRRMDFSHIAE